MTDGMEDIDEPRVWHNGVPEQPTQTVLTLWIADSSAEVQQWLRSGEIPLTKGNPKKGRYIGFRDSPERAVQRHAQRMDRVQKRPFVKEDTWVLEIRLDSEAFARMTTEKVDDIGWVTRLHYVTYPYRPEEWGVWYYRGQSFSLLTSGVYVFWPRVIW